MLACDECRGQSCNNTDMTMNLDVADLTRFNMFAIQGTPQMAVD